MRKRALLILCTVLVGALALSASRWGRYAAFLQISTESNHHSVDLKWGPSTSRVVGYNVYRSENLTGPYITLTAVPISKNSYTDRTAVSGHKYFYTVTAVDGRGLESVFSNQMEASIP